jgi:hypothetical protein
MASTSERVDFQLQIGSGNGLCYSHANACGHARPERLDVLNGKCNGIRPQALRPKAPLRLGTNKVGKRLLEDLLGLLVQDLVFELPLGGQLLAQSVVDEVRDVKNTEFLLSVSAYLGKPELPFVLDSIVP